MRISEILRDKAQNVITILSGTSVRAASIGMKNERVGALVVTNADGTLAGIVSERNIVMAVADHGMDVFKFTVRELMREAPPVAAPSDRVIDVMKIMTEKRVRHLPVMDAGQVVGLVSIGDVVKSRLSEQNDENAVLRDIARVRLAA